MDFSLSDTQLSVKASIVEFARNELNRDLINNDKKAHFPRDSWEKCAAMGLMALPIPSKYGGADGDLLTTIISVDCKYVLLGMNAKKKIIFQKFAQDNKYMRKQ